MITITDNAAKNLKKQLANHPSAKYVRFGVKGSGGCKGFMFVLQCEETKKDTDQLFLINEINLIVDPKSLPYVNDTTIDWKSSLLNSSFTFSSPNEKSRCSCGASVSLTKKEPTNE